MLLGLSSFLLEICTFGWVVNSTGFFKVKWCRILVWRPAVNWMTKALVLQLLKADQMPQLTSSVTTCRHSGNRSHQWEALSKARRNTCWQRYSPLLCFYNLLPPVGRPWGCPKCQESSTFRQLGSASEFCFWHCKAESREVAPGGENINSFLKQHVRISLQPY